MATFIVRVFYCINCSNIYEKRSLTLIAGKCPHCGSHRVVYQGDKKIETK